MADHAYDAYAVTSQRILTALADLRQVIEVRKPDTHYTNCHYDHAECLAARTIATLTGEDHPQ